MNFTEFDALNNNVGYFWAIASPVTVAIILIIGSGYITRLFRKLKGRVMRKNIRVLMYRSRWNRNFR